MNNQTQQYALLWSEKEHYFAVRSLNEALIDAKNDFYDHIAPEYVIIAIANSETEANELSYQFAKTRKLVFNESALNWQETQMISKTVTIPQ